jgi:hypothetical protein
MRLLHSCKRGDKKGGAGRKSSKLLNLAKRLEAALYKSAQSRKAYTTLHQNPSKLRLRVRELARESAMKRAILSAATPEAAAAVAANAGATVEEQAKIKEQHRRILRQRNRLMLLRHAARCTIPAGSCPTTNYCGSARKLWQHVLDCKGGQCDVAHCIESRQVLAHYRQCRDAHCLVCGPVRRAAMRSKEEEQERMRGPCTGYRKPGLLESLKFSELEIHINECKTENMGTVLGLLLRRTMENKKNKGLFNAPVDAVALGIPHYRDVIKAPMDLGTVRHKLERLAYARPGEFADDVALVFDNAMAFNPATHPIHICAAELKKAFVDEYDKALVRLDPAHKSRAQLAAERRILERQQRGGKGGGSATGKGGKGKKYRSSYDESSRRQRGILAPRKNGVCTLCQNEKCVSCPMCECGCRTFEAPSLHCRGTCGSRVFRNSSFYALPSTNYFVWCQSCYDNMRRGKELTIGNRTITKQMLIKKKNNGLYGEPWVCCDMCNEWMHQICGLYNPRAEAKYADGRFVCPICRHKVLKDEKEEKERKIKMEEAEKESGSVEEIAALLDASGGGNGDGGGATPNASPSPSPNNSAAGPSPTAGTPRPDPKSEVAAGAAGRPPKIKTELEGAGAAPPPQTPKTEQAATTKLLMGERPPGAIELPTCALSLLLQDSVDDMLKQERREESERAGVPLESVETAENICIRVVSSVDKIVKLFPHVAARTIYPAELTYRSKAILMFQRGEDDIDVCLFAMYVQEYGHDCIDPNKRFSYIAYLDSVNYLKPRKLRTKIYHELLLAYLESVKSRGFSTVFIWACPPPHKRDDYILHCHPETQRMPSADRLRQWYHEMIDIAIERSIIVESTTLYEEYLEHHHPLRIRRRIAYIKKERAARERKRKLREQAASGGGKKAGGAAGSPPKRPSRRSSVRETTPNADPGPRLTRAQRKRMRAEPAPSPAPAPAAPAPSFAEPRSSRRLRGGANGESGLVSLDAPASVGGVAGAAAGAGSVAPATKSDLEVLEELEPGVSRPLPPQLLPYFEGDFWPWEGEQVLKNLIKEDIKRAQDEEEKRFFESSDGTRRPRKTRRKVSTLAAGGGAGSAIDMTKPLQKIGDSTVVGGASADGPAAAGDTGKDALDESTVAALPAAKQELETQRLMRKLANMMEHMKPDFLVCKLKHTCSRCNHYILNGPRYFCRTCESVGKPFNLCEGCHAAEAKRAESGEACVSLHRNHTTKMRTDAELQLGSKKHERRAYSDKNKNLVVELNDIVIEHKKKNREAAAPKAPAPKADTPAGRVVAGAKEVEAIARQAKLRANKKRAKKRAEARQAGGADATGASLGPNGYHSGGGATSALKRANLENIIRVMSVGHDGEEEDPGEVDEDEQERRAAIPPHRLEKAEEATKEDTVDSDEKMDCPILNSRLALLGVCQGNRYQFDQKRRAKHSSMMLLYHLHNPKVPLYVHTCNECQKDILGDCRYNCKTCPDFDLCARCYRDVHHIHALKRIPVDVSGTGTEDQEERKQRSLALFLDSLVHTTSCRGCSRPECKKMRELLDHREKCRRRASGGCDTCQRILCLLQIHARRCKNEDCKVLYCNVLKKRIAQSNARKKKKAKADAPPSTSGSANTSTVAEKEKERPEGTGVAV